MFCQLFYCEEIWPVSLGLVLLIMTARKINPDYSFAFRAGYFLDWKKKHFANLPQTCHVYRVNTCTSPLDFNPGGDEQQQVRMQTLPRCCRQLRPLGHSKWHFMDEYLKMFRSDLSNHSTWRIFFFPLFSSVLTYLKRYRQIRPEKSKLAQLRFIPASPVTIFER